MKKKKPRRTICNAHRALQVEEEDVQQAPLSLSSPSGGRTGVSDRGYDDQIFERPLTADQIKQAEIAWVNRFIKKRGRKLEDYAELKRVNSVFGTTNRSKRLQQCSTKKGVKSVRRVENKGEQPPKALQKSSGRVGTASRAKTSRTLKRRAY